MSYRAIKCWYCGVEITTLNARHAIYCAIRRNREISK